MRQIKFRGWDTKRMLFRNLNDRNWYTSSKSCAKCVYGAMPEDRNRLVQMQYTGVKDQRRQDIYEGDIMEYGTQRCVVMFENGGFHLMGNGVTAHLSVMTLGRVLGNIYENKELLKNGKP